MGFQKRLRPLAELKFQQVQLFYSWGLLKLGRKLGNCVILKMEWNPVPSFPSPSQLLLLNTSFTCTKTLYCVVVVPLLDVFCIHLSPQDPALAQTIAACCELLLPTSVISLLPPHQYPGQINC